MFASHYIIQTNKGTPEGTSRFPPPASPHLPRRFTTAQETTLEDPGGNNPPLAGKCTVKTYPLFSTSSFCDPYDQQNCTAYLFWSYVKYWVCLFARCCLPVPLVRAMQAAGVSQVMFVCVLNPTLKREGAQRGVKPMQAKFQALASRSKKWEAS